jgi:hypothetical protein
MPSGDVVIDGDQSGLAVVTTTAAEMRFGVRVLMRPPVVCGREGAEAGDGPEPGTRDGDGRERREGRRAEGPASQRGGGGPEKGTGAGGLCGRRGAVNESEGATGKLRLDPPKVKGS